MASSTNSGDIYIRVGGSSPATIISRANALLRLANSLRILNVQMASGAMGSSSMAQLNSQVRQYNNNVNNARQRTDRFGTALRGTGNALDNFFTLFRRMVRIMTAFFIITTITEGVRAFVTTLAKAPAQMELWNTQLRVLVGNATAAAEKMKLLQSVAIETPQGLKDLVEGLVTLTAFHVETSDRTMRLLADLAAVTGQTFRHVAEVAGKVIQGSPQAITRSLPVLGIDPKEFKKVAAETGSRATALFQIIEEKFKGFASESTNTIIGLVEKIKDTFFVLMAEVGRGISPVIRTVLDNTFEWMNRIRNSPEELERMRVKLRQVVDTLAELGSVLVKGASKIKDFVDAIGGLRAILSVLAGVTLASLVAAFGTLSAVVGVLFGGAFLGFMHLVAKFSEKGREAAAVARDMATASKMFREQMDAISKLAAKDISLVNADEAEAIAKRLRSAAQGGDRNLMRDLIGDMIPEAKLIGHTGTLQNWTNALAASFEGMAKRARDAMGVISTSMGELEDEKIKDIEYTFFEVFDRMRAEWLKQQSEGIGFHDVISQLHENFEEMQNALADERFVKPFEVLQAKFSAGMLGKDAAKAAALQMRDQLSAEIKRLFGTGNELDAEIAIKLQGTISNIDSFVDGLHTDISQALESALRQAIKDGADFVSQALADMFVPTEGTNFGDAFLTMMAGFLNTFGDILIQAGIAALLLNDLFASLSVPSALAAIAGGIALKAFAGMLANAVKNRQEGRSGGATAGASGGGFAPFSPAARSVQPQTNVYISTMDAGGVKDYVERNASAFAAAVTHVKKQDAKTGGAAFGVFTPAPARSRG